MIEFSYENIRRKRIRKQNITKTIADKVFDLRLTCTILLESFTFTICECHDRTLLGAMSRIGISHSRQNSSTSSISILSNF